MEWAEILKAGAEIGGLLFLAYGTGKGAKGAAGWLKRRRAARDAKLRKGG